MGTNLIKYTLVKFYLNFFSYCSTKNFPHNTHFYSADFCPGSNADDKIADSSKLQRINNICSIDYLTTFYKKSTFLSITYKFLLFEKRSFLVLMIINVKLDKMLVIFVFCNQNNLSGSDKSFNNHVFLSS